MTLSLKDIYPLALEADEQLELLQKNEKGRFSAVFHADSGFLVNGNRFLPYLIELNDEIQSLKIMDSANQLPKITDIVRKIKTMHEILGRFHSVKDDNGTDTE